MPKVSVIIPIYNTEKYIERCLRSLFEQTLDDIEYIFIDDCTSDNSLKILKKVFLEYPKRISQVKLFRNKTNKGQAFTRKKGIKLATGDYIIHCDSDDWIDQNMYKEMYEEAVSKNLDYVWCKFYRCYSNRKEIDEQYCENNQLSIYRALLTGKLLGTIWNRLVKREICLDHNIIWGQSNFAEDLVLVFQYTNISKKIEYLDKPLYFYNQNEESITSVGMNRGKMQKGFDNFFPNANIILHYLMFLNLDNVLNNEIVYFKKFVKSYIPIETVSDCKLWSSCYKEINFSILFNPYISIRERLKSLLVWLRLYPLIFKYLHIV